MAVSPLRQWDFLVGTWASIPESQIGDPNGVTNTAEISHKPSNRYIFIQNNSMRGRKRVSEGWTILFFDQTLNKFKIKSIYDMGFIVNYTEHVTLENEITFVSESVDSCPPAFKDFIQIIKITKISKDEFNMSLKMGNDLSAMNVFWEASYRRA